MKPIFVLLAIVLSFAEALSISQLSLTEKFPSYEYVLREFDIDKHYIENVEFVDFVLTNEEKYRRFYENSARRGKKYIPLFKDLLVSDGLSHLFVYMSMTESGFQTYAKSSAHAAGLWQFMSATARRFNLKVDGKVDERFDPVASTEAASKYIRALYSMFGKWYLVMMAYNCGEGRLKKAIARAGTDDFETLMDSRLKYIPAETRRYLQKIVLLSMMGERIRTAPTKREKKIREKILPSTETLVNVYGGSSMSEIASLLDINPGELRRLNPQMIKDEIPEDISITQIFIPTRTLKRFRALYRPPTTQEIFAKRGYSKLIAHVVKRGESLREIAMKYRATELDLIIVNELKNKKLTPGKVLMIPVSKKIYESRLKY
jgi:membrane-bound lytic murein transglycosylase D